MKFQALMYVYLDSFSEKYFYAMFQKCSSSWKTYRTGLTVYTYLFPVSSFLQCCGYRPLFT